MKSLIYCSNLFYRIIFHLVMAALVTHKRVHKAWKARLAFQLFADKIYLLLAKVCQGTKILHNFERFVDLPQNRNFLTLFGLDARVFSRSLKSVTL